MNLEDAYRYFGIDESRSEDERFATYESRRDKLSAKLERAPTQGLKDRYQNALSEMEQAIEVIEIHFDENEPVPSYADAFDARGAVETIIAEPATPEIPQTIALDSEPEPSAKSGDNDINSVEQSMTVKVICRGISIFLFLAAIGAGKDVWNGVDVGTGILGGLVLLFLGVVFWSVTTPSRNSSCPKCSHPIEGIEDEVTQCSECKTYFESNGSSLKFASADTVAAKPIFKVELPDEFAWPNRCCKCPANATRVIEFSISKSATGKNLLIGAAGLAAGALIVKKGGGWSAGVDAPYCDECQDGISIEKKGDGFLILFCSFDFYSDFMELNECQPA
jgi:hypothetical protein